MSQDTSPAALDGNERGSTASDFAPRRSSASPRSQLTPEQRDQIGRGHGARQRRALARPLRAEAELALRLRRGVQRLPSVVGDRIVGNVATVTSRRAR